MTQIKPFIRCRDFWPCEIPKLHLLAYKVMIKSGQIEQRHVTYNKATGSTLVEYDAIAPHEWIKDQMRGLVTEWQNQ